MLRAGTYSIVARDPDTGELGAAVQSHWFSVGSVVSWARAGVGAVCTQSVAEPAYGPGLLDRLAAGEAPGAALAALLAADGQRGYRQVAVVAATGATAVHTGEGCIAFAGHEAGAEFSCQANMMASAAVWPAMAAAFAAAPAGLRSPAGCSAALEAAEGAGGDVRGRQSAALVVAPAEGEAWRRVVELRVEDHAEPLAELGRLLDLHDAYALATQGDDLAGRGRARGRRRGLPPLGGDGARQPRAAVLVGPGDVRRGRARGRAGRGPRGDRAAAGLGGAAAAPRRRHRAGGGRRGRGAAVLAPAQRSPGVLRGYSVTGTVEVQRGARRCGSAR